VTTVETFKKGEFFASTMVRGLSDQEVENTWLSGDTYEYKDAIGRSTGLVKRNGVLSAIQRSYFREPREITNQHYRIGVIGDTHGKVAQALSQMNDFAEQSGQPLDLIVQVGDLIDKPIAPLGEMGLGDLHDPLPAYSALGAEHLCFISGNHDQSPMHEYPVDDSFYYIDNGEIVEMNHRGAPILLGAAGWHTTGSQVQQMTRKGIHMLVSHNHHLLDVPMQVFGHHKDAVSRSEPDCNHFGLDHVNVPYRNGSLGIAYVDPVGGENEFIFLPEGLLKK
jgi:predicted phosphodiesterase